ncbi:MAG TPA: hypothetical protein VGK73_31400 [Polyangiaceae bacterium]
MTSPHSRARASKELAERFAELLKEPHSHQLGVCAQLGIQWHNHMDWMRARPEPGSDVDDYQRIVLAALDAQRRRDLTDMATDVEEAAGTHAATILNMRKWRHESRFKRFYDDAQKVEHSGPNGGPIDVRDLSTASDKDLLGLLAVTKTKADDAE